MSKSEKIAANNIPLSEPLISGNEWRYIKECLDTGWVSSVGGYVTRFEEAVARYVGAKYAVAVVNGTAALHVSLLACGVKPADEVIVPTLTFIAPVNTVRYCGAEPIFMDCDPATLGMDTTKLAEFINEHTVFKDDGYTYNNNTGKRIKAIIPVHVFGHPVDMDPLLKICTERNINVIEDATESLGSLYNNRYTATLGTIGCFSFNGNKIITTGGGGMIVTDHEDLAKEIRHLSTQAKKDPFEFDHDEIGYNYRLTNVQAAMGVAQMEKIDEFITKKRENAALYKKLLLNFDGVELIWEKPWAKSNFWFYTIKVAQQHKQPLIDHFLARGIQVRPVWRLMHTLSMYANCQTYRLESACEIYSRCINIPCSVSLKKEDIQLVSNKIKDYFVNKS